MVETVQLNTLVSHDLFDELQTIARDDNKDVQRIVEEAVMNYVSNRKNAMPRDSIMKLYESSLEKYTPLYERLAK